jgi:hypothetical protein
MIAHPGVRRLQPTWLLALALAGCSFTTEPAGEVADVRGSWQYSGEQTAPVLTLEGTLNIAAQSGDMVSGQLSWEERDPGGGTLVRGGPVSGRVIGTTDVDFDVLLAGTERRHVGRITRDTIRGAWVEVSSGRNGEFLAVRGAP